MSAMTVRCSDCGEELPVISAERHDVDGWYGGMGGYVTYTLDQNAVADHAMNAHGKSLARVEVRP